MTDENAGAATPDPAATAPASVPESQALPVESVPEAPPAEAPPAPIAPSDIVQGETASREQSRTAQPSVPTAQTARNEPFPSGSEPLSVMPSPPSPVLTAAAGNAAKKNRKRKRLDKIMEALALKDTITNDEVEKLLHVSDATATRHLSELEREGKIRQVGKTGRGVVYSSNHP